MRILLVANTLPPNDLSGVGEQVVQLASGLRARGHQVQVLGRPAKGLAARKPLFPLTVLPAVARALFRWRPHVVQIHESDCGLAALLIRVLAPLLAPQPRLVALLQVSYIEEMAAVRPIVWHGHRLARPSATEWRFRWFKAPLQIVLGTLSAWLADIVIAPSHRTASEVARDYQVEDVRVLPNVSGGLPRGRDDSMADSVESPCLLFVGRLRIRKGVEVLLEALSLMKGRQVTPPLYIVGDGEHRRMLERRCVDLGLTGQVRFLGRGTPEQVRGLFHVARALVVPSIYEGMPLVILEAMEAGLPVIASSVSGIPEVVADGESGWLVPPVAPGLLADALEEAWTTEEAERRGAAGRALLEAHYKPEHGARRWEEILAQSEA